MNQAESHPADETSVPTNAPAAATSASRQPRRRWFQFRLRTLMILMVVISILLAAFGWRLQRARRQAEAVAKLRKLGFIVEHDYRCHVDGTGDVQQANVAASPINPRLLRLFGEDFFHDVTSVQKFDFLQSQAEVDSAWIEIDRFPRVLQLRINLVDGLHQDVQRLRTLSELRRISIWSGVTDTAEADEAMGVLGTLTSLRELQLFHAFVSDDGMRHVRSLSHLHRLSLSSPSVTSEGLSHVSQLKQLEWLDLPDAQVDDRGIKHVVGLPKLWYLNIIGSKVTDDGLKDLAKLQSLKHLAVDQTQVTDAGLAHLGEFTNLEMFQLSWNPITDEGLRVAKFPRTIQHLAFRESKVTDDGIQSLSAYPSLKMLEVQGSSVTSAGAQRLRQALPGCNVMFSPPRKPGNK